MLRVDIIACFVKNSYQKHVRADSRAVWKNISLENFSPTLFRLFHVVCVIYLSEGLVPTLWDAIFDIKTKKLRNFLGFNTSVFIVYVSNG